MLTSALLNVFEGQLPAAHLKNVLTMVHEGTNCVSGGDAGKFFMELEAFMGIVLETAKHVRSALVKVCRFVAPLRCWTGW